MGERFVAAVPGSAVATGTAAVPANDAVPDAVVGAAGLLGWHGVVLPRTELLGKRVFPVVTVDRRAHEHRSVTGSGPVLDLDVLETWEWPETFPFREPEVVRLHGVISRERRWPAALAAASRLRGFASDAVVLGDGDGGGDEVARCLAACRRAMSGLVRDTGTATELLRHARPGRSARARRSPLDRWIEERLYGRVLDLGVLT
ncbi:hypothetical protein H0B56_22435 [Haloechinothrix sp. YIM 98757]|uniref:Uncharacterized protein n=1 Tax=Haloechinothrix aidingensis TaxID=2752311 RepID=A0A838AGC5_9PSEU|nr:hypothetical protein [Haloechinothrix aidingensis]MBA0128313.1 hypothetical protein [Haloechinothrix aidingensis]